MILDIRAHSLAQELGALSEVAGQYGWCDDDRQAKAIGKREFIRALAVAILLAKEAPKANWPVPGIHPAGTVWLSYVDEASQKGISLELRPTGYRWTQNHMGSKRTFESDSLNDVCEAMRTVFS